MLSMLTNCTNVNIVDARSLKCSCTIHSISSGSGAHLCSRSVMISTATAEKTYKIKTSNPSVYNIMFAEAIRPRTSIHNSRNLTSNRSIRTRRLKRAMRKTISKSSSNASSLPPMLAVIGSTIHSATTDTETSTASNQTHLSLTTLRPNTKTRSDSSMMYTVRKACSTLVKVATNSTSCESRALWSMPKMMLFKMMMSPLATSNSRERTMCAATVRVPAHRPEYFARFRERFVAMLPIMVELQLPRV
mmetsp:Transcript_28037/g.84530  ORF Transcript_28037/g.84530 Transcript_28037/m.84530 type:complete len:247 (+) Transcript_28037:509-1249(+)